MRLFNLVNHAIKRMKQNLKPKCFLCISSWNHFLSRNQFVKIKFFLLISMPNFLPKTELQFSSFDFPYSSIVCRACIIYFLDNPSIVQSSLVYNLARDRQQGLFNPRTCPAGCFDQLV